MKTSTICHISKNLYLINLTPKISGFKNFICSWLYSNNNLNILIDPGPQNTYEQIRNALNYLNIQKLDYIIITHIHLDHAGSIGHFNHDFPNTTIICHETGIEHLINPNKLWQQSVKTLGNIAKCYGKPIPVNINQLSNKTKISNIPNLKIIETPGHSSHHRSIVLDKYLFNGEAGGVLFILESGDIYMRPATPPKFYIEKSIQSIYSLMKTNTNFICYGHLAIIRKSEKTLQSHITQLKYWKSIIKKQIELTGRNNKTSLIQKCKNILLKTDPLLKGIKQMKKETQEREFFFISNSIKGFMEYIITQE